MDLERRSSKPEAASSSLAGVATRFGVVQLAGRLTLNQETKVRILSPKPIFFNFRAFRRRLYGLVLGASFRRFESCRPDQIFSNRFCADVVQRQEALVLETRWCEFKSHRRHYFFFTSKWRNDETHKVQPFPCENETRAGENPAFDTSLILDFRFWILDLLMANNTLN